MNDTIQHKMWHLIVMLLVIGIPLPGLAACDSDPETAPQKKAATESAGSSAAASPGEKTQPGSVSPRSESVRLRTDLRKQLDRLNERVNKAAERTQARSAKVGDEIALAWRKMIDLLQEKVKAARKLLERLDRTTEDERVDLERQTKESLKAIAEALRAAEMKLSP